VPRPSLLGRARTTVAQFRRNNTHPFAPPGRPTPIQSPPHPQLPSCNAGTAPHPFLRTGTFHPSSQTASLRARLQSCRTTLNEIGHGFSPAAKTASAGRNRSAEGRSGAHSAQRPIFRACHNSLTAGQALLLFQPAAPAPSPAPPPHWLRTSTPRRPSSRGPARSPRNQPRSTTA